MQRLLAFVDQRYLVRRVLGSTPCGDIPAQRVGAKNTDGISEHTMGPSTLKDHEDLALFL